MSLRKGKIGGRETRRGPSRDWHEMASVQVSVPAGEGVLVFGVTVGEEADDEEECRTE
eukprot:CAMPEP_0196723290 /NCGR_PEP_ID=MMETSP1091-20130531/5437_1 /TAXON_ID=302021 /ORGANISM="Rhodomonas sp., Strain CCMP768" /LENGTH=57 /DNA_ID=CAMNT_0042065171 /DNA_START=64 /DNA_END=234 /DNA_ORIENTATION=+